MRSVNMPVFHEFGAFLFLLFRGNDKIEIKHVLVLAKVFGWIAMAFETEAHGQGLDLLHFIKVIDLSMTLHTTDTAVDVDGMVKINVVWKFMNLNPGDGLAGRSALANQCQLIVVLQHLVMAVHTGRTGGDVRIPGFLHAVMAISAIDSKLRGVDIMGESDGLVGLVTDVGVLRCEIIIDPRRGGTGDKKCANGYFEGKPVCPPGKDV